MTEQAEQSPLPTISFTFTADEIRAMVRSRLCFKGIYLYDAADVRIIAQGSGWIAEWNGKGSISINAPKEVQQ